METLAKFTKFTYKRKITITDRYRIVQLYEEGYAISRIAVAIEVRTHSIRHHLQAMGVLEKDRKIKLWGEEVKTEKKIDKAITRKHPAHIQAIYRTMFNEDEEMRRRKPQKKNLRRIPHKKLLAAVPKSIPFKAAYSFTL